jgi:hypothetical protein
MEEEKSHKKKHRHPSKKIIIEEPKKLQKAESLT